MLTYYDVFFFFSSRRRHTRLVSDWSSDVCSSDLRQARALARHPDLVRHVEVELLDAVDSERELAGCVAAQQLRARRQVARSEERRVGKEWRSRGVSEH